MENVPVVENRTPILRGTPAGAAGFANALPVGGGGVFRVQAVMENMIHITVNRQSRPFILLSFPLFYRISRFLGSSFAIFMV
jgi:hypothetical protein